VRGLPVALPVALTVALTSSVLLAAAAPSPPPGPAPLSPQEARGRQIYRVGTSPSGGEIVAVLGDPGVEAPASSLPCSTCHGRDGRGRPEGDVAPSDLTWSTLTRPYDTTHVSGRTHPPYTARLLKRAVTLGLDPAGNRLHPAMPRYRLSQGDMDDLLAYLQRLGSEPVPGVSADAVRLGTLLEPGEAGAAVRSALAAALAEVNKAGGIYGRQLELASTVLPVGTPAERRAAAAAFLDGAPPFALVGAALSGADGELSTLAAERELPVVGAVSRTVRQETFPNPWVFYLGPGLEDQTRALISFSTHPAGAASGPPAVPLPRLAVAAAEGGLYDALAKAAEEELGRSGWAPVRRATFRPGALPADLASSLRDAGAEMLLVLSPGADALALLAQADALGWHPRVLTLAALAGGELVSAPSSFDGRVRLAVPLLPPAAGSEGAAEQARLAAGHRLGSDHAAVQLAAFAAVRLLADALRAAGRDLTRDRLVEILERQEPFPTPFGPPLAYSPGRRLGARGAWIVELNLARKTFLPVSGWVAVR
jgi:ABC-type branched-subunit amino acid transport system substrate-binding protein